MTFAETFALQAFSPFNFDLTSQIFESGDPEIRRYENGEFTQVLRINGNLVLVKITSSGETQEPKIIVELKSNKPLTTKDKQAAEETIRFIFNIGIDLCSFYKDIERDHTMSQIARQLFGLKNPTTSTVFESLVDSIVEQQISIKVAQTIEQRLVKKFGENLTIDGKVYYAYPTAQNIATAKLCDIQQVGLSLRKAEYILNASQLIVDSKLDLEQMKNEKNSDQIIAELDRIKGIGVWTAELTMLRGMQRLDALPADDFGIRRVISRYYCSGKPIKTIEAREIAEVWGTWKGLAAFYLIIAEAKNIKI